MSKEFDPPFIDGKFIGKLENELIRIRLFHYVSSLLENNSLK